MKYTKHPLTFEEQADLILSRGLKANRDLLIARLKSVNYYRFSAYLYPYRNSDDSFKSETTLERIWQDYTFDRRLRILVLDAIERVEVAVRTKVVYNFVHLYGPFGYAYHTNLQSINLNNHQEWLERLDKEIRRSKEAFVKSFKIKYGDCHNYLPLWMTAEIMTFGSLLTLFNGLEHTIQQNIAKEFRIPDRVLGSWLMVLNTVRNICAHHGRLWNRELGYKPLLPNKRKYPDWHTPVTIPNNRVFMILTLLKYLISFVDPRSTWPYRIIDLFAQYPDIPKESMGFPDGWESCPLWSIVMNNER